MANENTQNTALSESMAALEKCLDSMLAEQRKSAHNAIDMDDWSKAEEILARTKNNIARIESLKGKFVEFKNEAAKLEFIAADSSEAKEAKPVGAGPAKPSEETKTAPVSKPAEQAKPAAETQTAPSKPAEAPKPAETAKPTEPAKPAAPAKPAEQPKPAPTPAPAQPKPTPPPTPTPAPAQPKPAPAPAQPKPAPKQPEQPKPKPAPKPAEPVKQPAPAPTVQVSRPAENTTRLDFEMDDIDETPKPDPNNPIILACEELITRFPFSMKLISKHDKIGKFFRDDETAAKRDLSMPAQLSSGIWVETNVPEERVQVFIRSIKRYCDESVNA